MTVRPLLIIALLSAVVLAAVSYRGALIEKGRAEVRAEVSMQALKQIERAQDQTRTWQEAANDRTEAAHAAHREIAEQSRAIARLAERLRNTSPSADHLATATHTALSAYAADLGADFAACVREYGELGATAAGAAEAAWAHRDTWPKNTNAE